MKNLQTKAETLLCIIAMLVLSATPAVVPADTATNTATNTGSALDIEKETDAMTGSAIDFETDNSDSASGSAIDSESTTSTGSSITAEDITVTGEAKLPQVKRVVLPTVTDSTYDFVIDIDGMLSKFNDNYAEGDSVYFTSVLSPARLKPASRAGKLAVQTKTPKNGKDLLSQEFLGKTPEDALAEFPSGTYYLWQPDVASEIADGKWLSLTPGNVENFLTFEFDDTGKIMEVVFLEASFSETRELIWDGNIYTVTYKEISPADAAAQFYQQEQPDTLATYSNALLCVKITDLNGDEDYYPATLQPKQEGSVSYLPAVYTHSGASAPAIITNKSTFDICVTAELQVQNADWLNFCPSPDFGMFRARAANMYLAFTTGTHHAPVESGYSRASYILPGISQKPTPYLIISGSLDSEVIGIRYHYLSPLFSYSSVAFQLEAAIDTRESVDSAWDNYIAAIMEGTIEKPKINLVYQLHDVTVDEADPSCYTDDKGNRYFISNPEEGSKDYWVELILPPPQ